MKKYILIAGVNGAGKTTMYTSLGSFDGYEKINLDEVVRSIGNWKNPADVVKAGKLVVERINNYFANGISFTQETTLCGKSVLQNIDKAKALGYSLELYFIGIKSPELAKERVAHRMSKGGHGVSDQDIDRRYIESLHNLKKSLELFDKAYNFDNSESFRSLALYQNGNCVRRAKNLPAWFSDLL